jgi:hypothetical protein
MSANMSIETLVDNLFTVRKLLFEPGENSESVVAERRNKKDQ